MQRTSDVNISTHTSDYLPKSDLDYSIQMHLNVTVILEIIKFTCMGPLHQVSSGSKLIQ